MKTLHKAYSENLIRFPIFATALADQLGVSTESILALETGLCPITEKFSQWCWTFPERDDNGKVIGLSARDMSGKKRMVSGSKRGLIYPTQAIDTRTNTHWVRVSKEYPCPICQKADGCMYPSGEYDNPNSIVCVHIPSDTPFSDNAPGYHHIFDPSRLPQFRNSLLPSSLPVLVVEGASDVCAAFDLGFVGVGRPSAQGGGNYFPGLLSGRSVVILGENDTGAGRQGMESAFAKLKTKCSACTKLMPPEGVKDLRKWLQAGLTKEELLQYIENHGEQVASKNVLESDNPYYIANRWLEEEKQHGNTLALRTYRGGYIEFNGHCYEEKPLDIIDGELYRWLDGKQYQTEGQDVKIYKPAQRKVKDILHACTARCPIDGDSPMWINGATGPDPKRLIAFRNGVLDVDEYIKGNIILSNCDPNLFTFTVLPYDFDESLESRLMGDFLNDIFNEDQDKIALLAQWFGYNLVPDMSYEKLMFFIGRPRSGKGTTLEALQAMLGDRNCCETSFQNLTGSFGYQPLVGKLSAVIGDAKSPNRGDSSAVLEKILHITGRDAVSVNVKNKPHLPLIRLFCRFTIAMNDLPVFTDNSRALEYRTSLLQFNNSYVGREDRGLKAKLRAEAEQGKLVNWALRGLADLYKGPDFIMPRESAESMRSFRELVSPITEFCSVCLEPTDKEVGIPLDFLYGIWNWWIEREGRKHVLKQTFVRNLLATMPGTMQVRQGEIGNNDTLITGVKVTPWANEHFVKGN